MSECLIGGDPRFGLVSGSDERGIELEELRSSLSLDCNISKRGSICELEPAMGPSSNRLLPKLGNKPELVSWIALLERAGNLLDGFLSPRSRGRLDCGRCALCK